MLRSAPRSVRVLVEILVVVVIVAAVYLYAPPIGAVSPEAFQYSLAREVGGAKDGKDRSCVNVRPGVWRCVVDDPAAGGIVFELTRHGRRCWDATELNPGQGSLKPSASGCVDLRDQVRPEQRL